MNIFINSTKFGKNRKIRRCNEISLYEALAEWYIDKMNTNLTFIELYERWISWKETPLNIENIARLKASWKAYYLEEPLSQDIINMPFRKITTKILRDWAESLMKKYLPNKKMFSRIFTIMNQCYEYASDEDNAIVSDNLWIKAKKKLNKSLISKDVIPEDYTQVFTNEERKLIKQMVLDDLERYKSHPTSAGLQILFLFETGLRIGECCGLKWEDIKGKRLYIRRQANNERVKDMTKSPAGIRDIPLTQEALEILAKVKQYNQEHNFNAEWIFQSDNPKYDYRLSDGAADHKLRRLCNRMDSNERSPHKLRKTCLSALLDSPEVSNRTVQRFAGHSSIQITMSYYSFDRKTKEEQAIAIENALKV